MKLIDLNILLYAVNRDSVHHAAARVWLEQTLNDDEAIALPWIVLLGFVRISTNVRIMPMPITTQQAIEVVDQWLELSMVRTLNPGTEHWTILKTLLRDSGSAGNLTTDAHLAAMAIENNCELCSSDSDFSRFTGLHFSNPLA